MATITEQLTPTQIFKRQWESYQVVRQPLLQAMHCYTESTSQKIASAILHEVMFVICLSTALGRGLPGTQSFVRITAELYAAEGWSFETAGPWVW